MDNLKCKDQNTLEVALTDYRAITIKLIESLENDDYDSLEGLINQRQKLINTMSDMDYSKDEFKTQCSKLEIVMLQHKLDSLMVNKRNNLRQEMDNLSAAKNANRNYTKGFNVDSFFFNKKI